MMMSCSAKTAPEANASTAQVTQQAPAVAPVAKDGKVIELANAAELAPGVKVKQLTVVDFNAVWCGPCRQLAPVVEEMAKKYAGKVTFVSVDVDRFGDLFAAWNLGSSIPAVLFISPDGKTEAFIGTGELLPAAKFDNIIKARLK